ncbi:TniQ family protein, partial [Tateyamaria pelophila]|uniref:TniQ family protein n=1 Tax=Tateyamaria pelophila TaxID=328415 RepID=UPI001CBCA120
MLNPLPLRPAPNHRETIPSFLSRIAAMNGVGAADFALDMGFSLKRIINLEEVAVRSLAACGGLTDGQVDELISWTGRGGGDVRMVFRGEEFGSRALRNPIIRGCPVCLREDTEVDRDRPLIQMTMRGDWQMREINLCVEHRHPLLQLWNHILPTDRYDLSSRFAEILDDVMEGRLDQPFIQPSPYDFWLDTRLQTGADNTWLADHTLYAATTFCTLLGTELLRLETVSHLDKGAPLRRARTLGFGVASQGEVAILKALSELATLADSSSAGPQKAFGRLFVDFSQAHLDKADFTPFRKILRDSIVDIWPVSAGETVLGIVQPERQLHSILTASRETGIGQELLERFLTDIPQVACHLTRRSPDQACGSSIFY